MSHHRSLLPYLLALACCAREIAPSKAPPAPRAAASDGNLDAAAALEVENPVTPDAAPAEPSPAAAAPPPTAAEKPAPSAEPPLVLLLLDSSGSMEWSGNCTCSTPSCAECLPDCAHGQRSRWLMLLEAVTGHFADFACAELARTAEHGASYDLGYGKPHAQLSAATSQRDDGLIDRAAARVRFGVATFDSVRGDGKNSVDEVALARFDQTESSEAAGMFSFGAGPRLRADGSIAGKLFYPGCSEPYLIDTGIRSERATEGALILPSDPLTDRARIKQQLRDVRPFGSSPTAAAFDDLTLALSAPSLPATRYVVLITDGAADDDYRAFPSPGCGCGSREECGEDPAPMSCPYPTVRDAALQLHCGFAPDSCRGTVERVFVVALGAQDPATRSELESIAAAGGSDHAYYASGSEELGGALDGIIATIASAP